MSINFETAARYCCLAMLACLSFSTAGANLALVSFLVCGALSKKWIHDFHLIASSSVAKASLLCFLLLCISLIWSGVDLAVSLAWISKYKKLLILPLVIPFFKESKDRHLFIQVLFFSLLQGLVISYANYFGWTRTGDCPNMGCSTHSYITLSALNCLLFVNAFALFKVEASPNRRLFLGLCIIFSAVNLIFISPSRTGQILFFILIAWLPFAIWGGNAAHVRKKWIGALVALSLICIAFVALNAVKGSRLSESVDKIGAYKVEAFKSKNEEVSVDVRFEMYRKALALIQAKPLLGWGVGAHGGIRAYDSARYYAKREICFRKPPQ